MRIVAIILLVATALAGCAGESETPQSIDTDPTEEATSYAVVAHIDTGINAYHKTFRDDSPRAYLHPSTYIPDYPEDAIALNLTFDAEDFWAALKADCESVWKQIKPGQLYWFPGTRIIGGIYLDGPDGADCSRDRPRVNGILDHSGHGTMVASRSAGLDYGACQECLLVHIEGFDRLSTRWAAEQAAWIDAQSNSWGPFLPIPGPSEETANTGIVIYDTPELVRDIEWGGQQHLSFWASGNGALTRGGVLGHPTLLDPRMTPSIIMVGGHDSGYVNIWPDWPPHVVSDSCNSWAANIHSYDAEGDSVGGGTSGATPFSAGEAAEILLEARKLLGHTDTGVHDGVVARGDPGNITSGPLADGEFTLEEWKRLIFVTATDRPVAQMEDGPPCSGVFVLYNPLPVLWADVPRGYPEYMHIGYGATDDPAYERAVAVLRGEAEAPERPETDRYFATERPIRQAYHDAYAG